MNFSRTLWASVAIISACASLATAADEPFKAEITARKAVMQVSKFNIGMLAAMVKGKAPYDVETAQNAAYNLHLAALMKNGPMWPKGSGLDNPELVDKTAAKPEIWSTFPKVSEKHKVWTESTEALTKVAGNGLAELKTALGSVGKSCKGCHDDFRKKKK